MMLKKLINDPFDVVDELLEGFVGAHGEIVQAPAPRVIARRQKATDKVGLVIGGGSGHEPAFLGYVGLGVADAAAIGNVFAAPGADICLEAIRAASSGRGDDLDAVVRIAERTNEMSATIGVALAPCEVPGAGRPTFELGPDDLEIGMGIHGEAGLQRGRIEPADAVVDKMLDAILADQAARGLAPGEVALLVNGLGATAYLDLYIAYRAARRRLESAGWTVSRSFVGEYVTSLEMAGASISILRLDDELRGLLDAPARTARLGG